MKRNYKKITVSLLTLSYIIPSYARQEIDERPIQVPKGIDGSPVGINGWEVRKLLFIQKKVDQLVHGTWDPEKKCKVGRYLFENEWHSVAALAQYEIQHPHMDATIRSQLKTLLETAKGNFIKIAEPFVQQARGVKQITLRFMDEWAQKHNKEHSSLLRWGREKDGREFDTFKTETVTFQDLYEFCIDLMSFISDLVKSCPCAYQQFQEIQRQARNKTSEN